MDIIINYIIKFLLDNNKIEGLSSLVGYTSDFRLFSKYKVIIRPSSFFKENIYRKAESLPQLPLLMIEGVPLLFGSPHIEWYKDTMIVHADIIASSYFMLTRYEEISNRKTRDTHGRFPGKMSLPYRAGFIHRPIVDEYGKLLRGWLRQTGVNISDPENNIRKIWLTHDVDAPFYCRTLRNVVRETIQGIGWSKAWKFYKGPLEMDPYYTFPWLIQQNNLISKRLKKDKCETIFFLKPFGNSSQDKPFYNMNNKDIQTLLLLLNTNNITIGLHSSYDAGKKAELITAELKDLEKGIKQTVRYNRHHYLSSREPEDLDMLEKNGITDDFTMGYADVAGFRLGTSRPVHWINPNIKRITSLILHPLTLMDCTLSDTAYMSLSYQNSIQYAELLINQVKQFNGELVLLWHNDSVTVNIKNATTVKWQRKLYSYIINNIILNIDL